MGCATSSSRGLGSIQSAAVALPVTSEPTVLDNRNSYDQTGKKTSLSKSENRSEETTLHTRDQPEGEHTVAVNNPHANVQIIEHTSNATITGTDITERGVSLSFLSNFAAELDSNLTVADVVATIIRPRTESVHSSYFEIIPIQYTGRPEFFISHTWSRKFSDLVQALQHHFGVSSAADPVACRTIIWLDIFAINQHPYKTETGLLNDDVANLERVVGAVKQTLFYLDPRGVALTRIWCLFEIWKTIQVDNSVQRLRVMTLDLDFAELQHIYSVLDVGKAKATKQEDCDRILTDIKGSVGIDSMNSTIKSAILESSAAEVQRARNDDSSLTMAATLLKHAQLVSTFGGDREGVKGMIEEVLNIRTQHLGDDHPATLEARALLALSLSQLGLTEQSVALFRALCQVAEEKLGQEHASTLLWKQWMAAAMSTTSFRDEANSIMKSVIDIREKLTTEPERSAELADDLMTMASILNYQGKKDEVEGLLRRVYAIRLTLHGEEYPNTLHALANLAMELSRKGKDEEAEQMLRRAIAARNKIYGPNHPQNSGNLMFLGQILSRQQKYEEAEQVSRTCVLCMLAARHIYLNFGLKEHSNVLRLMGREAEIVAIADQVVLGIKMQVEANQSIMEESSFQPFLRNLIRYLESANLEQASAQLDALLSKAPTKS